MRNGRLTNSFITRLSRQVGVDWDSLAGLMDIPYEDREQIKQDEKNYPDIRSKAQKILNMFNEGSNFGRKLLVKFLEELGRHDVVETIKDFDQVQQIYDKHSVWFLFDYNHIFYIN